MSTYLANMRGSKSLIGALSPLLHDRMLLQPAEVWVLYSACHGCAPLTCHNGRGASSDAGGTTALSCIGNVIQPAVLRSRPNETVSTRYSDAHISGPLRMGQPARAN